MISRMSKLPKGYRTAVLHTHTTYSDGRVSPGDLVRSASSFGVRVLAICDHDTMAGVSEAKRVGKKLGIDVIAGEEIQTSLPRGLHVIGLFLKRPIPHSKSVAWTISEIQRQGGLAIIAHPLARIIGNIPSPTGAFQLRDLVNLRVRVDGIEVRYPSIKKSDIEKLDAFYKENKDLLGARIGSADSHHGEKDMFSYLTAFPGRSAGDLFRAIKRHETMAIRGFRQQVGFGDKIALYRTALVSMGLKRYGAMGKRWISFNFQNVDEFLN